MFCYTLLYVHSSFVIILIGKGELVSLLSLYSWCLMIVVWLFLAVPWVCLQFVVVGFPNHTHLLFFENGLVLMERIRSCRDRILSFQSSPFSFDKPGFHIDFT